MTLELKYFINPDKSVKEYPVLVTTGVQKKDDTGKKVLRYDLDFVKTKDFPKYELYPIGSATKAIIPTVKRK
jgi:hypothetical protein